MLDTAPGRRATLADLLTPHCVVQTLLIQQVRMLSGLDNVHQLEHKYRVCVHDRGEPVGNEDRDGLASSGYVADCTTYFFFCDGVERRCGLVKNEQ